MEEISRKGAKAQKLRRIYFNLFSFHDQAPLICALAPVQIFFLALRGAGLKRKNAGVILLFLSSYNQIPVILQRQVAIFIAKEVSIPVLIGISMCHVFELETQHMQLFPVGLDHLFTIR